VDHQERAGRTVPGRSAGRGFTGNRHYRLADIVRASTAAPGCFRPHWLQVAAGAPPVAFIDGGLSPYNNPSLALLAVAHMRAYGLGWPPGPERLLLISIGAGSYRRGQYGLAAPRLAGVLAFKALMDQVADGQQLALTLLQWFSEPALSWPINSEIGTLAGDVLDRRPLLVFQRYDVRLEAAWLAGRVRQPPAAADLLRLRTIDNPAAMPRLHALAAEVATT